MARFRFPISGKKIIALGLKYGGELAPAPFGTAIKLVGKLAGPMLEEQSAASGDASAPEQGAVQPFDTGGDEDEEEDEE